MTDSRPSGTSPSSRTLWRAELSRAAVGAAREARRNLARMMPTLSNLDEALARDLSFAISALYRAELDEGESLRDRLREAGAVMSGVLTRLHAPEHATALDSAGEALAKSLSVLYPARAGLERMLDDRSAEDDLEDAAVAPPAMLFEQPLVASFPKPEGARPVLHRAPSERPTHREPLSAAGTARQESEPAPALTPSKRLRKNALALVADAEEGLVDHLGTSGPVSGERRVRDRSEFSVDIGLHSATQFFAGISGDLSEGGLFVATYTPKPVGTELTASFVLPGGVAINTPAIVAWIRSVDPTQEGGPHPGMGLRFMALSPSDKKAIDRFLELRPPMIYEP